jgi:beta-1,4-mannosyltransferase
VSSAPDPASTPAGAAAPGRPLRVLQSVKPPSAQTNPYVVQLARTLREDGSDVRWFTTRTGLTWRYDVFHAHWPEIMLRRDGRPARLAARARFVLLMLRLQADRRVAVVRTLHNLGQHEAAGRTERLLLRWFDRRTDAWVALNDATPLPDPARGTVVLHGDYRDWYAGHEVPDAVPGRLLYFGLIRPYKGVDRLLATVEALLADSAVTLRVVGRPSTPDLRSLVEAACDRDRRVSALLDYVDDATLAREIGEAELVVLPYEDMHNSGALLLALSLDRPVLVPRSAVTVALEAEVGADWVHVYDGRGEGLTPDVVRQALKAVRECPATSSPDLSRRRWPRIAAEHAAVYRAALRRGRRRPAPPASP